MAMPERRKTVNVVNDSISDSANSHPCCDSSDFIEDMSMICDDMWWYVLEPSNRFYMILRSSLKQHIWNRRNLVSYVVRCQNVSKVSRCECGSSDHPSSETICCPGPVKTRIVRSDGIWIFQKTREECDKNQKHNTCHTSLLVKIGVFFFSSVPNLRRSVEKQHKTSLQTNEFHCSTVPNQKTMKDF